MKDLIYKDKIISKDLNLFFEEKQILKDVNFKIPQNSITAIIGPSGCGKSTLLRCMNRMNDLLPHAKIEGDIIIDGKNIYENGIDVVEIRRKIGMVFQRPNPFPKSIYDNIAYGLRVKGLKDKKKN
jgi:phosphate transport system ATP-binding protein